MVIWRRWDKGPIHADYLRQHDRPQTRTAVMNPPQAPRIAGSGRDPAPLALGWGETRNEKENEEFYNRISKSGEFGDIAMVQKKSIREGIQLWCLQNEIDILVAVTHGKSAFTRTFSGSVTRDLVKDNLLALLIISQN